MASVLVTGAAGFVGADTLRAFAEAGWSTRAAARRLPEVRAPGADWRAVGDIANPKAWEGVTGGIDCVVHAAARVHILRDTVADPVAAFREINVEATRRLALQAARDGVRRFVFLSSIGVNGSRTSGRAFTEADVPEPRGPYAISKLDAEIALRQVAEETGIELVIVRAPLMYGPHAPGNFGLLAKWIARGLPLPFANVTGNRRNLLYLRNLSDALVRCAAHPAAAGRLFLVADGETISTAGLINAMGEAMGRPARLWRVPQALLERAAAHSAALRQLMSSLVLDTARIRNELEWAPPYSLTEGLAASFASAAARR